MGSRYATNANSALGGTSTAAGGADVLAFGSLGAALGCNPTAAGGAGAMAFGVGAAIGGYPTAADDDEDGAVALPYGRQRLAMVEQRSLEWATVGERVQGKLRGLL